MKHPAPVLALVYRQSRRLKQQSKDLDMLWAELAVQQRRTSRWRTAAYEMAAFYPELARVVQLQGLSDDVADLPEVVTRNAPRSIP